MTLEAHLLTAIFPLMEGAAFDELVADIREYGLREPIVLYEDKILDGRNRYRACLEAGVAVRGEEYTGDDPAGYVISLNLHRRHLNESQRAMAAARLADMKRGVNQHAKICAPSQSDAAGLLNVSRRSIQHGRQVLKHGAPELVAAVERGEVAVSAGADLARLPDDEQREILAREEQEVLEKVRQIRIGHAVMRRAEFEQLTPPPLPPGKFETIVVDPPWPMTKIERDVRPSQTAFDYPVMTEDEIAEFDIAALAPDDCHLFMWTTQRWLPSALRIAAGWGFRYVCLFTWTKNGGFQPYDLPQFNTEHVIYARRGVPRFISTKAFFTGFDGRRREHSRKPDEFYDMVRRVTAGPRIDVFSREKREGFDQFGNETAKYREAAE